MVCYKKSIYSYIYKIYTYFFCIMHRLLRSQAAANSCRSISYVSRAICMNSIANTENIFFKLQKFTICNHCNCEQLRISTIYEYMYILHACDTVWALLMINGLTYLFFHFEHRCKFHCVDSMLINVGINPREWFWSLANFQFGSVRDAYINQGFHASQSPEAVPHVWQIMCTSRFGIKGMLLKQYQCPRYIDI